MGLKFYKGKEITYNCEQHFVQYANQTDKILHLYKQDENGLRYDYKRIKFNDVD